LYNLNYYGNQLLVAYFGFSSFGGTSILVDQEEPERRKSFEKDLRNTSRKTEQKVFSP
jgi:hypothetical protein